MTYHYNDKGEKKPCRAKKQCRFNKNRSTVTAYNDKEAALKYIQATPDEVDSSVKKWLDHIHTQIEPQSKIFELGSATGRDAKYLQTLGHKVDVSDISTPFLNELKNRGFVPYKFNALTDAFPAKEYSLVLANAVLLHLEKTHKFLKPGGKVAFTLKKGEGEEYSDVKIGKTRYFSYWDKSTLEKVLSEIGFHNYNIHAEKDYGVQWLQVVAEK